MPDPGRRRLPHSPIRFDVRVDGQLRDEVEGYMQANGMTRSQAVRILISLGLDKERQNPDGFRALAFREGLVLGLAYVKEQVMVQLSAAFKGMGV